MNMADFVNRAKDVRLRFTPDLNEIFGCGVALPGESLGLNQRRKENGVSLRAPKRTKTRCLRTPEYSSCREINFIPKHLEAAIALRSL